ncbi:hypothetical protein U0355_12055 [Salimicrobium sp. PL1-032A]|uniref:hypothetical protein n=1 Tax=Salimicrobium sp. PL1-032A TaxID=3095364 RepID=UPI0032602543
MEISLYILLILPFPLVIYLGARVSGYRKGNIVFHLDEWYKDYNNYVKAVERELKRRGRRAEYKGDYHFEIDGKMYVFHPQIVTVRRVPVQRTILQPKNKENDSDK